MGYSELSCKTFYSFLRGASSPESLITRAHELGLKAIAITDVGGVYGIPKAFKSLQQHPQLKLITGSELCTELGTLTLLAKTRSGYALLCQMLTQAHKDQPKGQSYLSLDHLNAFLDDARAKDLFALCRTQDPLLTKHCSDRLKGNVYVMLSRFLDGLDDVRTKNAVLLSQELNLKIVATNDVHYAESHQYKLQDILSSIREGKTLDQAGFTHFSNSERYLKTEKQMQALFIDLPLAIQATQEVSDACTFCPSELRYRYPSEWIPINMTSQSYLEHLIQEEIPKRYPQGAPQDVLKQLHHELNLITQLHFEDYFLTVYDIVAFAKSSNILCQGRGSAANSIVCYVLGITAVDPVKMSLLFERFISAERGEPPDIDIDFEHERREEVIQYVYQKYGRDRAAMVSAVVTYQRRSAFREIAKVFGVDVGTLSSQKIEKHFKTLSQGKTELEPIINSFAQSMEGFPRHLSIHSGGFTLSADLMTEIVPIEPASMENRTIVQWDKYDLDILGLLKIDLLSLGMLSALRKTLSLVGMQLHQIPADDLITYQMIQKADTIGTFQIESRAQMSLLPRLLPKNFYDLVIEVAIMRPGPIVGQMVHPYLRRRRGLEAIDIPHHLLEPILGRTLGVPIFQEQVMKMAVVLAGFSPGEADQLRRAIGAWRSAGSIEILGTKLMNGLISNGVSRAFADKIFLQIQGFAEYGFPESHAASFALLAYASCYLKAHFPAQYSASLINSQPMGFYSNHTLIDDAKRHGVIVLPVALHESNWDCKMVDSNTFRLGYRVVHGISKTDFDKIDQARKLKQFASLSDFMCRSGVKRNLIRTLALGDVFQCFNQDQRHILWNLIYSDSLLQRQHQQLDLFESLQTNHPTVFSPLSPLESISLDYKSFNLSTRGHPMKLIRQNIKQIPKLKSSDIKKFRHGATGVIVGLAIVMQRPPTAKGTVFATLEDEDGFVDLVLRKDVYLKYKEALLGDGLMIVSGKIQKDLGSVSVLVQHIKTLPFLKSESKDCKRSEGVLVG